MTGDGRDSGQRRWGWGWQLAATVGGDGREVGCVDEHAKLKTKLKTKQSSQPQATSPTFVSTHITWGPTQVSWIPDESHKGSHKGSHKDNRS